MYLDDRHGFTRRTENLIYLIILLLQELVLLLMQNPCFVHPRLQPPSGFSNTAPQHSFGQRTIMAVYVWNIYFLSFYCLRNLSLNLSVKAVDIYLDHLSDLAAFISTSNYSETKIPARRERPMSIITREKEFWMYFWLFMACSTTVLSKAIQKFLLVMKLASY